MRVKVFAVLVMLAACTDSGPKPVKVVSLTTAAFEVSVGGTRYLQYYVLDENNSVWAGTATWSSSNANIATVSEGGRVTGISPGVATISVSAGGKSHSAEATVTSMAAAGWIGSLSNQNLSLKLKESNGVITGTGIRNGIGLTASGTYSGSSISFTLTAPGFQPMSFTGVVAPTTMTGTMNGSGYSNEPLTLSKVIETG